MRVVAQEDGAPTSQGIVILGEIVTGLPKFNIEQYGVCKGCALGKHAKVAFPSNEHSETSKAYKVYITEQRKTVVSKDIKVKEDFASRKSHEPITMTKDEDQEATKLEPGSPVISRAVQQLSGEEGERVAPSTYVGRPRTFKICRGSYQVHMSLVHLLISSSCLDIRPAEVKT
jgi:hypothetical protein